MIKLLINGACGQMGRTILQMLRAQQEEFEVLGGVDASGAGEVEGVRVYASLQEAPSGADVVIDFSRPEAVGGMVAYARETGAKLVVCTTGLGEEEHAALNHAAEQVAVFQSGNMSLGVNLQIELIKSAAEALGSGFDIEIIEKHHNRKVDAPSGTALMLADAVSAEFPAGRAYAFGRHSKNERRKPNELGIHAIRGGTVVGEHEVAFYGEDEVVTIMHQAYSKKVFGAGALRAAQYIMGKKSGRYSMRDIVTEHNVLSHIYTDAEQSIITVSGLPNTPGVMQSIFSIVAKANVFVDMISMTSPDGNTAQVSFSLHKAHLAAAMNALKALGGEYAHADVFAMDNLTKITVEGPGMALRHGVAAELFAVLAKAGVSIELVTTSETKISCCVKNSALAAALSAISGQYKL